MAKAQAGRSRARDARLKAARERRQQLDPDQLAREQRIDEAVVDIEVAWEARHDAQQAVVEAEVAAARSLDRLLGERLAVKDAVRLTGLDQTTVRRLRRMELETNDDAEGSDTSGDASRPEGSGR